MKIKSQDYTSSKAQLSRAAIQRLYIAMRHLFIRGSYKPLGTSGAAMIDALLQLNPEIYGSIADPEKVELDGLLYIFQRLPRGIEECRFVKLISSEGYQNSNFQRLIPDKRRRFCYRIDEEQMYIEMTRGRSDIYDVLTHLTFLYVEAEKIRSNSLDIKGKKRKAWSAFEKYVKLSDEEKSENIEVGYSHMSTILGRTFDETVEASKRFDEASEVNSLFNIVYWIGKLSIEEFKEKTDREISFSSTLRDKLGHHIFGELWANRIKQHLLLNGLIERPIHVISANLHSVMNMFYAHEALGEINGDNDIMDLAQELSRRDNEVLRKKVKNYALTKGMIEIHDPAGTNITVQIFDCEKLEGVKLPSELQRFYDCKDKPVLLIMDYAFGEQAYECMDELLKPFGADNREYRLDVKSINIMGKAGILKGGKGDIMVPSAHVFEGSADNYPFVNAFDAAIFDDSGLSVFEGNMITVLGTSLQNRDILQYFHNSSWKAIGLEMEGAHYQKAIQAASKIRSSVNPNLKLRYAYYASDNPIKTGATLASGGLGIDGVLPTYYITLSMLQGIFDSNTE